MLIGYLLLINAVSFILMLADKRKAVKKRWRIPESTFVTLAILGGAIGVIAGMQAFHHKTRHLKFSLVMPVILAVQILLIIVIFAFLQ